MKDFALPPELSEDHDEIVDLAVALARNEMEPAKAAAFRERMANDAIVRAVAAPIIEAYRAQPLTDAEFEPRWARFRERSGMADLTRLAEQQTAGDLSAYEARVKSRKHGWVRRTAIAAALVLGLVWGATGYWVYLEYANFDHRAARADEIRTVFLPDKSVAELQPGSNIKWHETFASRNWRRVWVEGEVRFDITPTPGVSYEIEGTVARVFVVGTRFTVQAHDGMTTVSVERGMVSVQALDANKEPTGTLKTIKAGSRVRVTRAGIVPEADSIPQPRQP